MRSGGELASAVARYRDGAPAAHQSQPAIHHQPGGSPTAEATATCSESIWATGYLANASARSPVLEISLDPRYPGIVSECSLAIQRVGGTKAKASLRTTPKGEAIRLVAKSRLWPLVFPQHGPGKKHERAIALARWQQDIVDRFPHEFLRGLFCASCEQLGIRWTQSSYKNISVADRRSVAILDSFVGPKNLCGRRDLNPHGPKPTRT